ncbi:hypothetical protein AAE250_14750 [Bacteroides sp. GD17]|jgi:hypothetical protein|uniref:hypothetical protein n=1 Tax=Bacteroides sp. GD17 TaxID=3139826 RepID=UPI0025F6DF6C|nr:hypothetical protein [uncultured Bacteroides sp.]
MKEYIVCIALIIAALSLAALILLSRHYEQAERTYTRTIANQLREQDRMTRKMEHLRIEKETIERILKEQFPEPGQLPEPDSATPAKEKTGRDP